MENRWSYRFSRWENNFFSWNPFLRDKSPKTGLSSRSGPLNRVCPLIAWKLYPMSSDKLKGEIVAHEIKLARYRSNLVSDSLFSLLTNTMQHAPLPPKFLLKLSINRASQRKCSSSLPILSGKWNSVRSVIRYGVSSGEILWGNGDLFVFRYRRMIAVNLE